MTPIVTKKSALALSSKICDGQKGGQKRLIFSDFFGQFSKSLTNDPSNESSHRGQKDSIICSYSKNDSIARYRRVNLKIVTFETSISPSSSKTRKFYSHILSFRPLIYQSQLKLRTNTKILNKKFSSVKAIYII